MNEHISQNESKNWNSGSCPAEETQDGFLKQTNQSQSNFWGVISAAASFLCSVLKRCHLVMNLWSEVAFQILTSRTVRRDLLFCIPCAAPQTLPCCMKVQVWDYNKSYLEFKVCSFHGEVRPSSSLSALLFFVFFPLFLHLSLSPFSPSLFHTIFGELHFWAAERIPWRVATTTIPRIRDTLFFFPHLLLVTSG